MKLRLQHAADRLTRDKDLVSDITLQSGFENTSAFCRTFKAAYGVSPEAFRKQNGH